MPRPKAQRPPAVPWPELGAGQAERLRFMRKERKWSLRDLAAAASVSTSAIQDIEKGKGGASAEVLAAIADALHVPRGWLAFGG